MVGKKNVVFGFFYLVITASMGPYMITNYYPDLGAAQQDKQASVGRLQTLRDNGYEEELEPLGVDKLAQANTDGILALNQLANARLPIDAMKGGAHAHGNLEALLNIVVGLALGFITVAPLFKQLISWIFILGALVHSGGLLLNALFGISLFVGPVGPLLILLGLLLMGVAAFIGFQTKSG